MNLSIGFRLDHRYNLGTGLCQFCLGNHKSSISKVLKARVYQHQVIAGGGGAPTLEDVAYFMAPYEVSFPEMVAIARSAQTRLRVVL